MKDIKHKNLLFFMILIISNLISFELGSLPTAATTPKKSLYREGYVYLRIQALSHVPFIKGSPIQVVKKNQTLTTAFLIDQEAETKSYIVYLPEENLHKIIKTSGLEIIPYSRIIPKPYYKRRKYEISIR